MPASARAWTATTIETFDSWLESQGPDPRWELVGGEIVAMTNPTEVHEQIALNIAAALKPVVDRLGCRAYAGGIRIQRSEDKSDTNKPRPDIVVRCGPVGRRNFITDPLAVVEVLSPSTMDFDRGDKLVFYKSLPTLRHIALVYQDEMRVELYVRSGEEWQAEALTIPVARLAFEAVQFEMTLEQAYFGVELSA